MEFDLAKIKQSRPQLFRLGSKRGGLLAQERPATNASPNLGPLEEWAPLTSPSPQPPLSPLVLARDAFSVSPSVGGVTPVVGDRAVDRQSSSSSTGGGQSGGERQEYPMSHSASCSPIDELLHAPAHLARVQRVTPRLECS